MARKKLNIKISDTDKTTAIDKMVRKNISRPPNIDYSKKIIEKEGLSFIRSRFKNKFSNTQQIAVNNILLKPEIFQGRNVPFASETVAKIVKEGFDTSQDPIVLFKDKDKNIVISGHSRFEAAKKLKLKTIPVKFFNGDLDDAIDFALIESNRSGKAEGIESDIKAYLRAKQRGYNREFLKSIFKTDSYIDILRLYSFKEK